MTTTFAPYLAVLPPAQLQLWPKLAQQTPAQFVLYGGTAIALRLGHRHSVDFDFFSAKPFSRQKLYRAVPYLKDSQILQQEDHTLTCCISMPGCDDPVKVSYFGTLDMGQIRSPTRTRDTGLPVASLIDLLGHKCSVVAMRCEKKDYLDIHAILNQTSLRLEDGIAAAKTLYGSKQYHDFMTLKALSYFKGGNVDTLSPGIQKDLARWVRAVDLSKVPTLKKQRVMGLPQSQKGLER